MSSLFHLTLRIVSRLALFLAVAAAVISQYRHMIVAAPVSGFSVSICCVHRGWIFTTTTSQGRFYADTGLRIRDQAIDICFGAAKEQDSDGLRYVFRRMGVTLLSIRNSMVDTTYVASFSHWLTVSVLFLICVVHLKVLNTRNKAAGFSTAPQSEE